ncbi:hypothetical protein LSAT2_020105, partial [Lamellibrachia satsuma]
KQRVARQHTSRIRSQGDHLRAAREQRQQRVSCEVNNSNANGVGETGAAGGGNVVAADSVHIVHTVTEPVVSSSSSTKRKFDLLDGAQMPAVDTDSVESSSVNSDSDGDRATMVVSEFNAGTERTVTATIATLGFQQGSSKKKLTPRKDLKRLASMKRKCDRVEQKKCQTRHLQRIQLDNMLEMAEGGASYGAGAH